MVRGQTLKKGILDYGTQKNYNIAFEMYFM